MNTSIANPAKIADEVYGRFARIPGFDRFMHSVSLLSALASTPGWEDPSGNKTQPGAKPIGLKQWGDAQMIAGLITEAVAGAPWPEPAIDTEDCGLILLQWQASANAQLDLVLRSSLVHKAYEWTQMRDGFRSEPHRSNDPREVIASLRSVVLGAKC